MRGLTSLPGRGSSSSGDMKNNGENGGQQTVHRQIKTSTVEESTGMILDNAIGAIGGQSTLMASDLSAGMLPWRQKVDDDVQMIVDNDIENQKIEKMDNNQNDNGLAGNAIEDDVMPPRKGSKGSSIFLN